jgi:hypothetical protein
LREDEAPSLLDEGIRGNVDASATQLHGARGPSSSSGAARAAGSAAQYERAQQGKDATSWTMSPPPP